MIFQISECVQLINGSTHRLGNYLDLVLTDALGVVNYVFDDLLGNWDQSSISFTLKLGFCISSTTFSRQVDLKSHVDWSRVRQDL